MADKNPKQETVAEVDVEALVEDETDEGEAEITGIRPEELAKTLKMKDAKRIRAFLRSEFTRPESQKNSSWMLTEEQAEAVIARFTPATDDEVEVEGDEDTDTES